MPPLAPAELRSRLALDYRVVMGLSRETIGEIVAFGSRADITRERPATVAEGEDGLAFLYAVEYRFPHLVGRGRTASSAIALFDLHAGGNYPYSPPAVAFLRPPYPWSPHVHPGSGVVCLGYAWQSAAGGVLLAHGVVHVMRLMNFDEPAATASRDHLNASAMEYWRTELRRRPFLPELRYPRPPVEITHGVGEACAAFRPLGESVRAEPDNQLADAVLFRAAGGR